MNDADYMYMASKLSDEIEITREALRLQMEANVILMRRLGFDDQAIADSTAQARNVLYPHPLNQMRAGETVGEWTTRIQGWPPVTNRGGK